MILMKAYLLVHELCTVLGSSVVFPRTSTAHTSLLAHELWTPLGFSVVYPRASAAHISLLAHRQVSVWYIHAQAQHTPLYWLMKYTHH